MTLRKILVSLLALPFLTAFPLPPTSISEARALLNTSPLSEIDGIWHDEEDDATILILNDNIYLIDSPDCRLNPGDKLGTITPTLTQNLYSLNIFSQWKKGNLINPVPVTANLNAAANTLQLNTRKLKISFSPSIILPRFFGFIRLGVRIKRDDKSPEIPVGWLKIYPVPSTPTPTSRPIYL